MVTEAQVFAIATQMAARGERPTIKSVREGLKPCSPTALQPFLQNRRNLQGPQAKAAPMEIPEAAQTASQTLAKQLCRHGAQQ